MKIIVTTTYRDATPEFLKWMANQMKERGQISNDEAIKLRKGHLVKETKSDNPNEIMTSTTEWRVEEDAFCEHCGCKLAKHLGGLEMHKGDCPNIPF